MTPLQTAQTLTTQVGLICNALGFDVTINLTSSSSQTKPDLEKVMLRLQQVPGLLAKTSRYIIEADARRTQIMPK